MFAFMPGWDTHVLLAITFAKLHARMHCLHDAQNLCFFCCGGCMFALWGFHWIVIIVALTRSCCSAHTNAHKVFYFRACSIASFLHAVFTCNHTALWCWYTYCYNAARKVFIVLGSQIVELLCTNNRSVWHKWNTGNLGEDDLNWIIFLEVPPVVLLLLCSGGDDVPAIKPGSVHTRHALQLPAVSAAWNSWSYTCWIGALSHGVIPLGPG